MVKAACACDAVPRMAMPNPPAISAPTTAKIFLNIAITTLGMDYKSIDENVPQRPTDEPSKLYELVVRIYA